MGDPRWRINLSVPLVLEYEQTLKCVCTGHGLTGSDVDDLTSFLCANATLRPILFLSPPFLPDPKDDFVLKLTVESWADFLLTFNTRDFAGADRFGVGVILPRELLAIIGRRHDSQCDSSRRDVPPDSGVSRANKSPSSVSRRRP